MIHKILPVGPLQCNCSILGDEQSREAMVIDPGDQIEEILDILRQARLTLKQIVITHAHIDHVGGAMKLKAGAVKVDEVLSEAQVLKIGPIPATVIHTPGHTEGSSCLYFPEEKKLIAGDTLFAGSIGRTDLPGGSFDKIIRSLHTRLLVLPDDTEVIPGHGPGTTIGEEREMNPFLQK